MTEYEYIEEHWLDYDDGEPIRADWNPVLDYEDMADYIQSWPDKLISFFRDHLVTDEYQPFVRDFYKYACEADKDGPAFEEWRVS